MSIILLLLCYGTYFTGTVPYTVLRGPPRIEVHSTILNKATSGLRVVHTETILFLKSITEGVGSDIERLRHFEFKSRHLQLILSRSISDPTLSELDFKN